MCRPSKNKPRAIPPLCSITRSHRALRQPSQLCRCHIGSHPRPPRRTACRYGSARQQIGLRLAAPSGPRLAARSSAQMAQWFRPAPRVAASQSRTVLRPHARTHACPQTGWASTPSVRTATEHRPVEAEGGRVPQRTCTGSPTTFTQHNRTALVPPVPTAVATAATPQAPAGIDPLACLAVAPHGAIFGADQAPGAGCIVVAVPVSVSGPSGAAGFLNEACSRGWLVRSGQKTRCATRHGHYQCQETLSCYFPCTRFFYSRGARAHPTPSPQLPIPAVGERGT